MQLCTINLKSTVQKARHAWQNWLETGLSDRSPNLAPVLKNHRAIQQQISQRAYQNLAQRINGSRTLRELASAMEQDESKVARSLANYIQKGWIDLVEIDDIDRPTPKVERVETTAPPIPRRKRDRAPLVACVDDSPQTCELMREIIEGAGYRFVAVTDSVQVLPVLLERKPDLIFLDLIMPVANGYEICSQLRRVEQFAQTPIAILTSKDGVVDRMRAKMVKASNFLNKPIESEKVLAIVRKYLGDLNAPAPKRSSKPQTKPAISSPPQPMASGTSFANSIASSA
jgi:chemotaxis family two-component system response regulator PixG